MGNRPSVFYFRFLPRSFISVIVFATEASPSTPRV